LPNLLKWIEPTRNFVKKLFNKTKNLTSQIKKSVRKKPIETNKTNKPTQDSRNLANNSENFLSDDLKKDCNEIYNNNLFFKRKVITHMGTWFKKGLHGTRMYFPAACTRSIIYETEKEKMDGVFSKFIQMPVYNRTFWWVHGHDPPQHEKEIHFDLFDNYVAYHEEKDLCSVSYYAELQLKMTLSNILIFHVEEKDIFGEREIEMLSAIFLIGIHEWIKNKKGKTILLFLVYKDDERRVWDKIEEAEDDIDNFNKMNEIWTEEYPEENVKKKIFPIWLHALEKYKMNQLTCPVQLEEIFEINAETMLLHGKQHVYQHSLLFEWRNKKHIYYNNLIKFKEEEVPDLNNSESAKSTFEMAIAGLSSGIVYLSPTPKNEEEIVQLIDAYKIFQVVYSLKSNAIEIFKKWNTVVSKGKVIENFGTTSYSLIMQTFYLVEELVHYDGLTEEVMGNVANWFKIRIKRLLTKQIIILQEKSLEYYKDLLLDLIMDPKRNFDAEKNQLLEQAMALFDKKTDYIKIGTTLAYQKGRDELKRVMVVFSSRFKDSLVVKLNSLDRIEKQTSPSNLKEKSMVIGFGITAAFRPHGYGNFQFVSHYSQGPHVFNFSLVNDRDFAVSDGQSNVRPLRIQPSLNFDIDL
jgi:hypothetical protein